MAEHPEPASAPVRVPRSAGDRWAPVAVVAALALLGFCWGLAGERIPAGRGAGFDGAGVYAPLAANFVTTVRQFTLERVPRVLPSLVIHVALRGLGVERGLDQIVVAFAVMNLVLLALGLVMWHRVCDALHLSVRGRWLASAAFISFGALKMAFYAPVLTDTTAFVLAIGALLAYLRSNTAGLGLCLALAAFTWPSLTWSGTLLLAFPRRREGDEQAPASSRLACALALALAGGIGGLAVNNAYLSGPVVGVGGELPLRRELLPLSIACLVLWLFVAARAMLAAPWLMSPRAVWARAWLPGVVAAVGGIIAWKVALAATGLPPGKSIVRFMLLGPDSAVTRGVRLPLLFVVAHAVYFGPIVLLAIVHARAVCAEAWTHGVGMTAFLLLGIVTAITPESRHALHVMPFLVAMTAAALDRRGGIGWLELGVVVGLGAVASKALLPMGAATGDAQLSLWLYMAHHGPWMPEAAYVWQGAACVALLLILLRSRRPLASTP